MAHITTDKTTERVGRTVNGSTKKYADEKARAEINSHDDRLATIEAKSKSDELLVDLGLPSGTLWATRNLDVTQPNGLAASPFQYECSFVSWGNTDAHNPISTSAFSYDWGSGNDGPYASTPGASLSSDFKLGYDAANASLGGKWRMPTTDEFAELFNSSYTKYIDAEGNEVDGSNKLVTVNGITGIYMESKINGKRIFFACSGDGLGSSWDSRGSFGFYWSSSLYSAANGRLLLFYSGGVGPQGSNDRFYGFAVRPVQSSSNGGGYGKCTTDATTAAKTATVDGYNLAKGQAVTVQFTKAVSVANPTLNISNTGAKAIYYMDIPVQPNIIRPNNIVTMIYDGEKYNIVSIEGLEQSDDPANNWVDMGLPSGLKWARKSIDITQTDGFAASEFQYECTFFSWGNTEGHNPADASSFSYDWGSGNDGPYASTSGAALTANIAPTFDAARANLGAPWRMPTTEEFAELFNYCDFVQEDGYTVIDSGTANKLVTVNGITGIYLKSKINGRLLFFACSGFGYGSSWVARGSNGDYWSSSLYSATNGRNLSFSSGGVYPQDNYGRFHGFAVRPVQ